MRAAGDMTPIAQILEGLDAAKAAQRKRLHVVLEADCPRCDYIGDSRFQRCVFRGQEICKHAGALERLARRASRRQRMIEGEVPRGLHDPILTSLMDKSKDSATAAARRLLAREGKIAVCAGPAGNAKSSAGALVIAERGGYFLQAARLDDLEIGKPLLSRARDCGTLVLDDVGRGTSATKMAIGRTEELICIRWDKGLPTFVTTNLLEDADAQRGMVGFWDLFGGRGGRVHDRIASDPIGWVWCLEQSKREPAHWAEPAERDP